MASSSVWKQVIEKLWSWRSKPRCNEVNAGAKIAGELLVAVNAVSAKSGGAATYALNLIRDADMLSPFRFVIFVPDSVRIPQIPDGGPMEVISVKSNALRGLRRLWFDQVTLRRFIRSRNVGILLSSSDFGMVHPSCKQVLLVRNLLFFSELYRKRFLARMSWRTRAEYHCRRWLVCLSMRNSVIVLTATKGAAAAIAGEVPSVGPKLRVNPFGVPERMFNGHLTDVCQTATKVLYVSEYSDYKNVTTLFKAMLRLTREVSDGWRLSTTADPVDFPEYQSTTREQDFVLARELRASGVLCRLGRCPYESIGSLYTSHDLFVFPSLVESFGHPLLEAMAAGLPVLAADTPVTREICGDAAVYFSGEDHCELAEQLRLLRDNVEARKRMRRAGLARVRLFRWDRHLRELASHLAGLSKETSVPNNGAEA